MEKKSRLSSLLLLLPLLSAASASADWESKFTAVSSKGEFPKIIGKVYVRADRLRVDSPYPFEMSVYVKNGSKQADTAVHSFRIRLTSNPEAFSGQLPACLGQSFDACVKSLKLKKLSTEKCGEVDCDIYEGKPKWKGVKSVKIWHPTSEKEAILAKSILRKSDGSTITTDFSDIAKTSRPDSFFVVPANYKNAGSLEKFFGDLRGKDQP
jgi:hypothetical protein